MFNITEIKNKNRHRKVDKKEAIPLDDLYELWPEENIQMPYFSVVPEQIQRDPRYQRLNRGQQGEFWRLCIGIATPGERGRFVDAGPVMAKRMGMTLEEWETFKRALLTGGLLQTTPDGLYLIQPELREQCLQYARSK